MDTNNAPLHTRTCFAQSSRGGFDSERDVMRIQVNDNSILLVLANAYECGFATAYPEGSRFFLDELERCWASLAPESLSPATRLRRAYCNAAEQFLQVTRSWAEPDPFLGGISASATAVLLTETEAIAIWVGAERVVLLSEGLCQNCLLGDCHAARSPQQNARRVPCAWDHDGKSKLRGIIGRTISHELDWEPQLVRWFLPKSYDLLLASSQFPTLVCVRDLVLLESMTPPERQQWCDKNQQPYVALLRCARGARTPKSDPD